MGKNKLIALNRYRFIIDINYWKHQFDNINNSKSIPKIKHIFIKRLNTKCFEVFNDILFNEKEILNLNEVQQNGYNIVFIKNPSPEVQLAAVQKRWI